MGVMNVWDDGGSRGSEGRGYRLEQDGADSPVNLPHQVHVEIDEFVLTGFSRSEGQDIAESVRETLGRLFAGDAARWSGFDSMQVDSLDAGKVQLRRSGRIQSTGEQVARAIHGSLPR